MAAVTKPSGINPNPLQAHDIHEEAEVAPSTTTINDIENVTAVRTEDRTPLYTPMKTQPKWRMVQDFFGNKPIGEKYGVPDGEEEIPFCKKELTVLEPSRFRRISELFWSVVYDMWRSAGGAIGAVLPGCLKALISDDCAAALEDPDLADERGTELYSAVKKLNTQTQASSPIVHAYCAYLEEEHQNAQYIPNFVQANAANAVLPDRKPSCNRLLIPIVLKGFPCNHIVALCISYDKDKDGETATIEFYDSKGLTIADRFDQRLANKPDMTLGKLIATLTSHYCAEVRADSIIQVKENTTKQQRDSHNCGIYVSRFFEYRLKGATPEMLYGAQFTYKNTVAIRQNMITNLLPRLFAQAAEHAAKKPEIEEIPEEDENEPNPVDKALYDPTHHDVLKELARFREGGKPPIDFYMEHMEGMSSSSLEIEPL